MQVRLQEDWDDYNADMARGMNVQFKIDTGAEKSTPVTSYTHHFLKGHQLEKFLNNDCNRILQFGASDGRYIAQQKENGWSVKAWEFSEEAIRLLRMKGISTEHKDLNELDQSKSHLLYSKQLIEDVSQPVNIFLFRILQYLELPALNLLLFTLIDNAAPGSVFFIAGNSDEYKAGSDEFTSRTRKYKACFFATRTDFEFLTFAQVNADDELLVFRKLPPKSDSTQVSNSEEEKSALGTKERVKTLQLAIRSSKHNGGIKLNFISILTKDVNQTKWCFELAEEIRNIINDNKARTAQEYLSAYRDGAKRHNILETKLNEVIETLSQGNLNHAKDLINDTIHQLRVSQANMLFTSPVPEIEILSKLYSHIAQGTAVDLQPSLIKKTGYRS